MTEVAPERWAAALGRRRDVVNASARAAIAQGVAPAAVADALRQIGPAFEAHCRGRDADDWALELAEAALRALVAHQWSPRTVVPWTVTELLPRLAGSMEAPGTAVRDVVHAAGEVWRAGDLALWGGLLLAGAAAGRRSSGPMSAETLRVVGVLAAWRAGHVRMRVAAHEQAGRLDPTVLAAAVDIDDAGLAHEAMAANWSEPVSWLPDEVRERHGDSAGADGRGGDGAGGAKAVRRIGGFRGFGGPFLEPPTVRSGDGLRWQVDAAGGWDLLADVHGDWLVAAPTDGSDPAATPAVTAAGDAPIVRRVVHGRSVLLSSPRTHHLLLARTSGATS